MEFLRHSHYYGIGSKMDVSYKNEGCGGATEGDTLRYLHPSCSMIKKSIYLTLRPFVEHGAPCCFNMIDAQDKGIPIMGVDVWENVLHLSGASWCEPKTIWRDDMDVIVRPFFTVLFNNPEQLTGLQNQIDGDFEIIQIPNKKPSEKVSVHWVEIGIEPKKSQYLVRLNVKGEYVIDLTQNEFAYGTVPTNFIISSKMECIKLKAPDEYHNMGFRIMKRRNWQLNEALK